MKKIKIVGLLLSLIGSATGWSQDTLLVYKKEIALKAADKNLQLKIAQQEFQAAQADYRQSNALFLPSITASHTAISTTNPLMAFGSKLNQEILTQADFNPALLNNPARTQNFATKIEILQPIINVDGYYGRQAAKAKMNAYELQTERSKEYLELEVNKAFMQLQLAYQAVNDLKQGLLQKTDLLSVQVRVNEIKNQLQYAKSNIQNASDYLAFLLNEDTKNAVFKPVEALETALAYLSKTPFVTFNGGCTQLALRLANSSSEILRLIVFLTASMLITSPSSIKAIPPPS